MTREELGTFRTIPFGLAVLTLIVGCNRGGPVSAVPESTPGPTSIATEASLTTPLTGGNAFPIERSTRHVLLFYGDAQTSIPERERGVYSFDYETGATGRVVGFPTEEDFSPSMYLSPDGTWLIAASYGMGVNGTQALRQIGLVDDETAELLLQRGGEMLLPRVDGREPEPIAGGAPPASPISLIDIIDSVLWAPEGTEFTFTVGRDLRDIDRHSNGQIYLVERGSTSALPLATSATGNDIGFSASWSSDGNSISYVRCALWCSLWVVDLDEPASAHQVIAEAYNLGAEWLPVAVRLIVSDYDYLGFVDPVTGDRSPILDPPFQLGEFTTYELIGPTGNNSGYIVVERHERDGVLERARQRALRVDLNTLEATEFLTGDTFHDVLPLPEADWVLALGDDPSTASVVSALNGRVIWGSSTAFPVEEIVNGLAARSVLPPEVIARAFALADYRDWISQDAHLIAIPGGPELLVWDVLTGGYTEVAPELEGDKTFIGWIADPDAWEAAIQAGAP